MPEQRPAGQPRLALHPITHEHKEHLMQISSQIWNGHDYLPMVFDRWVGDADSRFLGLFANDRLVGCGRMMPFDDDRLWMEALRVDPADHGKGWGREITRRMLLIAIEEGYKEFYFSTYFRNTASIRITEQFGFAIIAKHSFLLMKLDTPAAENSAPAGEAHQQAREDQGMCEDRACCRPAHQPAISIEGVSLPVPADSLGMEVQPGIPEVDEYLWNDWLFVPADVPRRERYFPRPETVRYRDCSLLVCENTKYSPDTLDIGWISFSDTASIKPCVDYARARARLENRRQLQLMLPESLPVEPFHELGFRSFEQALDVFLFRAKSDQLRL